MTHPHPSEWLQDAPLIIAHRGASRYAPENTLAAFRLAGEMGAQAIELDAKLTRDGQVVVHHDRTLERTTTGAGKLSAHTLDQLKQLDAGRKFSASFTGEGIPTLEEVFEAVSSSVLINVELTNYERPMDALPEEVVRLVKAAGLQARVLFSSLNPLSLRRAKRLAPEIPRALVVRASAAGLKRAVYRWVSPQQAYHPEDPMVTPETILREHRAGRRVNVWTVNDPARIRELLDWGVDGVITDVPDLALRARDGRSGTG
ncbi:MAG: hypothetical protein MUO23_11115 [Anaerolineales bacterium]|nr:hypothetical protein [Anaerolineales bacterium]